jgi:hypothetical protein
MRAPKNNKKYFQKFSLRASLPSRADQFAGRGSFFFFSFAAEPRPALPDLQWSRSTFLSSRSASREVSSSACIGVSVIDALSALFVSPFPLSLRVGN